MPETPVLHGTEPAPAAVAALTSTLRVVGALFTVFFGLAFLVVVADVPVTGTVAHLTRWGHGGEAYELMITALYTVWGVYLWRAARSPYDHASFLDFTLTANAVHFGVMLVLGIAVDGEHLHLAGDVLIGWLAIAAIAATWLPVRAAYRSGARPPTAPTSPSPTARDPRSRPVRPERWAARGFVLGAAITVPATFVALLSPIGEDLLPYLVPSLLLLAPLSDVAATWPGLVTVLLAAVLNGLVVGAVAGALAVGLAGRGRR